MVHVTARRLPVPPDRSLFLRVVSEIGAGYISYGRPDEDIRREVLFTGQASQAHASGQRICAPLNPRIMRITVRKHAGKCEAGGGVAGRECLAACPKLAPAVT